MGTEHGSTGLAGLENLDRYILITSDTHAGLDPALYEPYLEKKWLGDFPAWVEAGDAMAKVMRQFMGERSIGVSGHPDTDANRNWDSARRLAETEECPTNRVTRKSSTR